MFDSRVRLLPASSNFVHAVLCNQFFEIVNFLKKISADDKKENKLPSMQRVELDVWLIDTVKVD